MNDTKDILLAESGDGGDISIVNGDIALAEVLYQQVYLCLFGGNVAASTRGNELVTEERFDWWGNALLYSDDKSRQFNSETERALNANALTSAGRQAIQKAVEADLAALNNIAEITVGTTLSGINRITINIKMTQPGSRQQSTLQLLWDNAKKELIIDRTI